MAAALDPSFEGGDRKVLKFGRFAEADEIETREGVFQAAYRKRWVIEVRETIDVPIDAGSGITIHYQIVNFVKAECMKRGIASTYFGLDSTGEGGGLKAIFENEWGPVIGVEFGGMPSDDPVNAGDGKTCREAYDRKATELHMQVREFAISNGLRGLTDQSCKEHCARRTDYRGKKLTVEPKGSRIVGGQKVKGFKDRLGYSPDEADCDAVLVAVCRHHGAVASLGEFAPQVPDEQMEQLAVESQSDWSDENYAHPEVEFVGFEV
jgi:hypothetical protein